MQTLLNALTALDPDWEEALRQVLAISGAKGARLERQGREMVVGEMGPGPAAAFRLEVGGRRLGRLELSGDMDATAAAECAAILSLATNGEDLVSSFEQFRKGAAHDIRGCLGRASSLVDMIAEKLGSNNEAQGLATIVTQQLTTGEKLVRELAAFAQAATKPSKITALPLQGVLDTLVYNMRRKVEAAGGQLQVAGAGVSITGHEAAIVDAMERVIQNSLLYAGDNPRITITVDGARLWIIDSGPAFDGQYAERIFEPFFRLHGNRYPGHGLGLAIARKLVEGVGGRMAARPADPTGLAIELELRAA